MVKPAKNDLTIYQGTTFTKTWAWSVGGTPVDLTGCTVRSQIRQTINSQTSLLEMSTEDGRIVLDDPQAGVFSARIEAEDTAALKFSTGVYDLEIVFPDGTVARLLFGKVTLSPEVTR